MEIRRTTCYGYRSPYKLGIMKTRLSYKIFFSLFFTAAVIAALLIGMQFYAIRNFSEYVNRVELDKLESLESRLITIYDQNHDWMPLQNNGEGWHSLLEESGTDMRPPPHRPPPHERRGHPEPPRRRPFEEDRAEKHSQFQRRPPPPPHKPSDPFSIGPFLALFNSNKSLVVGFRQPVEAFTLKPIKSGNHIIGWLGLHRIPKEMSDAPAAAFLKRQSTFFLLITAAALILMAILTLILSRQILGPVKALTEGTQALISRRFHQRIPVRSQDELGRLAEGFNTMAQTLEQYEAMRQQWIIDISHELRTPLSVLRGEIEALQDGVRKADAKSLSSLHAEAVRIGKLVDDLHLLSLADSQDLVFKESKLDPVRVLRETVGVFQNRVEERGLRLDLDIEGRISAEIEGNQDRLNQVFANILENTLRYADAPGKLRISARSAGKLFTIRFEDSGPGVPSESLPRLFDRLYRVDSSRSRESGGSGLGLAICRQIVAAHQGIMEAKNSSLGGLAIQITFET